MPLPLQGQVDQNYTSKMQHTYTTESVIVGAKFPIFLLFFHQFIFLSLVTSYVTYTFNTAWNFFFPLLQLFILSAMKVSSSRLKNNYYLMPAEWGVHCRVGADGSMKLCTPILVSHVSHNTIFVVCWLIVHISIFLTLHVVLRPPQLG